MRLTGDKTSIDLSGRQSLPNLLDLMEELLAFTTPPVRLTRRTLSEIFRRYSKKDAALANPQAFATAAVGILKEKLADHLVAGVKYEKVDEWWEMGTFESEIPSWRDYLIPAERSVYDHVIFESEPERRFVEGLEKRDDVVLYLKLPSWFTIPTPVGEYNPDWAIVMEDRDEHGEAVGEKLYLVRETKDTGWETGLRAEEYRKIRCGAAHFRDIHVDYRVITDASDLP
jgi:type III restriction enzyme